MKNLKFSIAGILFLVVLAFFGCKKDAQSLLLTSNAGKISAALDPLILSCAAVSGASIDVTVCAGASGAAAGFSIQWETVADYNLYGWSSANAPSYRCASLSGIPGCATNNALTGPSGNHNCVTVNIGDNLFDKCGESSECGPTGLDCNTAYIFRAFAHNVPQGLKASDKSGTTTCTTFPCATIGCTLTQGYWKTHGPVGCAAGNNTDQWFDNITNPAIPAQVTSLKLGTISYTDLQLCSILNAPAGGNGLLTLAHQLIAAKLNIAKGADPSALGTAIADADALIGTNLTPPVGSGSVAASATSALVTTLTNYNEGTTGPGHCNN